MKTIKKTNKSFMTKKLNDTQTKQLIGGDGGNQSGRATGMKHKP